MAFTLHVDSVKFRSHLRDVHAELAHVSAHLTPVIKGNGYGFGRDLLAKEAALLNVTKICVGTVWEVESVAPHFPNLIHVLEPFNPRDAVSVGKWRHVVSQFGDRVVATVTDTDVSLLSQVGIRHIIIEGLTSLHRFGLTPDQITHLMRNLPADLTLHGFNLHLAIASPQKSDLPVQPSSTSSSSSVKVQEIVGWIDYLQQHATNSDTPISISVSHLEVAEISSLSNQIRNVTLDARVGTGLWLGAKGALKVTGTVLAVHDVSTTTGVGYTQTRGGRRLIVVSGGTSHGVALAAPVTRSSLRKRAIAIAEGFSQAVGKVRSPFIHSGRNLHFAEPPHMHVSLLWSDDKDICVGDELLCTVRNTTTQFDVVLGLQN